MTETLTRDVDLATYTGPWKNLIFLKDGRSVFGFHVFPTQTAAARGAADGERICNAWLRLGVDVRVVRRGGELVYLTSEYSHCIQVPVGDAE